MILNKKMFGIDNEMLRRAQHDSATNGSLIKHLVLELSC